MLGSIRAVDVNSRGNLLDAQAGIESADAASGFRQPRSRGNLLDAQAGIESDDSTPQPQNVSHAAAIYSILKRALNPSAHTRGYPAAGAAIYSMLKRALNRCAEHDDELFPHAAIYSMLKRALNRTAPPPV